ncbi:MAG: metal-dependent hydrolase [Methylotenera sp.]|nr:metal-dependent hydrolase [Oligoflexia bacterium]
MFIFGHLGIGSKMVSPVTRGLPRRFVLIGAILPDLIDKPLYYALSLATVKSGSELGLISGTRTVGHTGIFLLLLTCAAIARRSRVLAALVLGVASHLILDGVSDHFANINGTAIGASSAAIALIFPLQGVRFAVLPFSNVGEHLGSLRQPWFYITEAAGALILFWDYWKSANKREITARFQAQRTERRRLKNHRRQAIKAEMSKRL